MILSKLPNSECAAIPAIFPSPFSDVPHPLALQAALLLQDDLIKDDFCEHDFFAKDGGKMFGVLVVELENSELVFLRGFSGKLGDQWVHHQFVPPIFEPSVFDSFVPQAEQALNELTNKIAWIINSPEYLSACENAGDIKFKGEEAANNLRLVLLEKKAQRKLKREACKNNMDEAQRDEILASLSQESHQDKREKIALRKKWLRRNAEAESMVKPFNEELRQLEQLRKSISETLHKNIFASYELHNGKGDVAHLSEFYSENSPPLDSGDCAGSKLLQYANKKGLKPIALAEFWWGAPPAQGIRHHGYFYPSCRGKCRPIFPFLLSHVVVEAEPEPDLVDENGELDVVYEDDDLLVVNKPAGLLSVPGAEVSDSVFSRLQERYPEATGPLVVHRLDLATSGLLLAAKTSDIHKELQKQFIERIVEKRYVALLEGILEKHEGTIELPLRVDFGDRPRQLVCPIWGKEARTHWEVLAREEGRTRVYFYPYTGRTHQLRVHAAHRDGLNMPIVGDGFYGKREERLMLHAQWLAFNHPTTGKRLEINADSPF